jgi:hypothetical protein
LAMVGIGKAPGLAPEFFMANQSALQKQFIQKENHSRC